MELLKERLNDRYAIYVKHLDSAYQASFNDELAKFAS